ncbi:MAG: GGDEF domain-containing protein [Huintestinicola sp.]
MIVNQLAQILRGDGIVAHKTKYRFVQLGCEAVHFILILVFLWLKVIPLAVFNMFSTAGYFLLGKRVVREKYAELYYYTSIEIILHSFVATYLVGWEFGFQMYIIAFIPVMFYMHFTIDGASTMKQSVLLGTVSGVAFIFCRFITMGRPPMYYTPPAASAVMYAFNAFCAFALQIAFSIMFTVEIRTSHSVLSERNAELNQMANIDALTGLLNRRSMAVCLEKAVNGGKPFSVIMCDIDDFKHVNDTYGHDCGDLVLKSIADVIKGGLRDFDCVCRWGGEEILILTGNTELPGAANVAERIRDRVESMAIEHEGQIISVTMTLGVAEYAADVPIDEIIAIADERLYKGKKSGKNCVVTE